MSGREPDSGEIHKAKRRLTKLGRRGFVKTLIGMGFSATTATALTAEDIKAASGDEVPIALDIDGEEKVMVSKDWYNTVRHTEQVLNDNKYEWQNKDGVISVGMTARETTDEEPHLIVTLEHDSSNKDDARRDIPDEKNGVNVEFREGDTPQTVQCSNYDDTNTSPDVPGGLHLEIVGNNGLTGGGTITSMVRHDPLEDAGPYWGCAQHVSPDVCGNMEGGEVYHPDTNGTLIGYVHKTFPVTDFMVITPVSGNGPLTEVAKAYDTSTRDQIGGTLNNDGLAYYHDNNDQYPVIKNGYATCETTGTFEEYGVVGGIAGACNATYDNLVRWGDAGSVEPGDSGSIAYVENVNDPSEYLVLCINQAEDDVAGDAFGTEGWHIYESHSYQWVG